MNATVLYTDDILPCVDPFQTFSVDMTPMRMRRRALGISRRRLAILMGVNAVTIWRYERNQTTPTLRHLLTISRILGIPATDLYVVREGRRVREA